MRKVLSIKLGDVVTLVHKYGTFPVRHEEEVLSKNNAETGEAVTIMSTYNNLPSTLHPGDEGVKLAIPGQPELLHGKITKVHFCDPPKVLYDLEFRIGGKGRTRIHNVDSAFVLDMFWEPSKIEHTGEDDPRYQKNSRGRWELKPECRELV